MALTGAQIATAAELTGEDETDLTTKAASLTSYRETRIANALSTYDTIKDKITVETEGGRDGVKFSNMPLIVDLRQRVRKAFGYPIISDEMLSLDPDAMQLFELEVGSNFG